MRQLRKARNRRVIVHSSEHVFEGILVQADFECIELSKVREVSNPSNPVSLDGSLLVPNASILFAQVL